MTSQDKAKKLLEPILDVMNGADGGSAFARLRHSFLPEMIEREVMLDGQARELMLVIRRFSKLCEVMLKKK